MALGQVPVRFGKVFTLLSIALMGCAEVPVHDVTKSFAVEVREITESGGPIKLDFLWVIDNSSSMCQEQYALAKSFSNFQTQLQTYLNIDIRLAVTTTDAVGDAGKFVYSPASKFLLSCVEAKPLACWPKDGGAPDECTAEYGAGWRCVKVGQTAADIYNYNGSVNTYCTFRCNSYEDCCQNFCNDAFGVTCASDDGCLDQKCSDWSPECNFSCRQPGQLTATGNGCVREPDTQGCPDSFTGFLNNDTMEYFGCMALVEPKQDFGSGMEQGLKSAWLALDPQGPNAAQVAGFLRDDAYLVVAFVSDEDDCSIDTEFCSPAWTCTSDADCQGFGVCRRDQALSYFMRKEVSTCCGTIKKDHFDRCALLGDYKGKLHHETAYDLSKNDCEIDEDCDEGWQCSTVVTGRKKCRPKIFGFQSISSYPVWTSQTEMVDFRTGAPLFALTPVTDYYSRFRGLKEDPAKVLVAAITGDALVKSGDEESLISTACLEDERLQACVDYLAAKLTASPECLEDPMAKACKEIYNLKKECSRQCYIASKGSTKNYEVSKNTKICGNQFGKADYGSRYVRLAEMFGPTGMVSNICSEDGIAPALKTIAELIIKRVTKICLPMEPKEGQTIVVSRILKVKDPQTGEEKEVVERLVEGEDEDFRIEYPTQDCCDPDPAVKDRRVCRGTLKAILFNEVQDPKARMEVRYEGTVEAASE